MTGPSLAAPAPRPTMTPAEMPPTMVPTPYRVVDRREETYDTVTLTLEPVAAPIPAYRPGQFTMLYAFGVGEVPISISGGDGGTLVQTLRAVGAVTRALCAAEPGATIGVRGPFGTEWDVPSAAGRDVIIVAGGIGLAPLRPVVLAALADRSRFRRVGVLIGARTPRDLLFTDQFAGWRARGAEVAVTVDQADTEWLGDVGLVTALVDHAEFDPGGAAAFVCGPEVMMRFTARSLRRRGVAADRIRVSLERNMKCGVGLCGHCQLGPLLLCRDGPVRSYADIADLIVVKEL
ncbi:MAG TPA: FAD/NAD(P)-binding protein [Streptosporangiaceae bacterium]|nr:FAD/NAD(P)-binding protein [Streptosporangiaceae bacterium]